MSTVGMTVSKALQGLCDPSNLLRYLHLSLKRRPKKGQSRSAERSEDGIGARLLFRARARGHGVAALLTALRPVDGVQPQILTK